MHPRSAALTELEARCAAAGIPLTSQRRAVLEAVAARSDHPTVDQIYAAVAERLPDISRATVYRSLETLVGLGLLKRVEHPGSAVRFDAKTGPHHHFLCTLCGAITDLPLEAVEGHEALAFRGPQALVAQELAILVRGTCGCAASTDS